MDHAAIDDNHLVERYLMGRLAPEEAEAFEDHYLDCPQCLDRLELTKRLRRGLMEVATEEGTRAVRQLGILAWLARRSRSRQAALLVTAAVVLVLLPSGLLMHRLDRLREELAAEPEVNTPIILLSPVRSGPGEGPPATRIAMPPAPGWVVLVPELHRPAHDRYRATLLRGEQELWRNDDLVANDFDQLVITVHSTLLAAGDYAVVVEGLPSVGEPVPVARFTFRVE
jgi:hypothetical protein